MTLLFQCQKDVLPHKHTVIETISEDNNTVVHSPNGSKSASPMPSTNGTPFNFTGFLSNPNAQKSSSRAKIVKMGQPDENLMASLDDQSMSFDLSSPAPSETSVVIDIEIGKLILFFLGLKLSLG